MSFACLGLLVRPLPLVCFACGVVCFACVLVCVCFACACSCVFCLCSCLLCWSACVYLACVCFACVRLFLLVRALLALLCASSCVLLVVRACLGLFGGRDHSHASCTCLLILVWLLFGMSSLSCVLGFVTFHIFLHVFCLYLSACCSIL